MNTFSDSLATALQLVVAFDPALWVVVGRSLAVSATACLIAGGLGLVLLYAAPGWVLLRRLWREDDAGRLFAGAGVMICASYLVFGITEMMFRDMRSASFYATWVAVFLALSDPARRRQAD